MYGVQVTKSAEALLQQESALLERSSQASTGSKQDLLWGEGKRQRTRDAYAAAPRFVLLNFRCVSSGAGLTGLSSALACSTQPCLPACLRKLQT